MTQGLYELLGADPSADRDALQAAYTRAVAQLVRRRRSVIEQGGDAQRLDLHREQVDEAWSVLADPVRRRRYDALRVLTEDGDLPTGDALWERVSGSLASPAAAAAVEVVRSLTRVEVGALPAAAGAPEGEPTYVDGPYAAPFDTQADVPTEAIPPPSQVARHMETPRPSPLLAFPQGPAPVAGDRRPTPASVPPRPSFQVVHGESAPVLQMPTPGAPVVATPTPAPAPAAPAPAVDSIDALVAELGWSGDLLKRVRESKGLSLRDMGDSTRISARYLEAIENDDFGHLPSSTFVKGYLREMARTLQLDEDALVRGYMRRMG